MTDRIETIEGSTVQHGHHNDRIYVMHLASHRSDQLIPKLDVLAWKNGYGKIFAKVPRSHWEPFQRAGFVQEAVIPGFFKGHTDGLFVAKFFSARRQATNHLDRCAPLDRCTADGPTATKRSANLFDCSPSDAQSLARLYAFVFESYAFPIHRPSHLRWSMANNIFYVGVKKDDRLVAAAAAEVDFENQNCEMTDFATLPACQGKGLAGMLLHRLEGRLSHWEVKTAYTIARVDSPAMNRVFEAARYRFAGRLINNTQIGGRIRSMNVWYKSWPSS